MKKYIFLVALMTVGAVLSAQSDDCRDYVFLKDGSLLKGKITSYDFATELVMTTWSGLEMRIPVSGVSKIKQRCKDDPRRMRLSSAPYSFREKGWYHATRGTLLAGSSASGISLQHSSGVMISRLFGLGVGTGIEQFNTGYYSPPNYPVYAEIRGYLLQRNVTPFYTLGAGYSFMPRQRNDVQIFDGNNSMWKGGYMLQGQIGYRIGNHFTVHGGVRLQRMTEEWTSSWLSSFYGTNTYLNKRFELGIGLLL